jgi:hypothetical protein
MKVLRKQPLTFIPKPGEASYTEAKAYHPITLSSFLLKTMEKLVDRYIRDDVMRISPLHQNQFAYQTGKSMENALHNVVTRAENAMEHKEIALAAFNRTSFAATAKVAERHGVETTIGRWINSMLESRSMKPH